MGEAIFTSISKWRLLNSWNCQHPFGKKYIKDVYDHLIALGQLDPHKTIWVSYLKSYLPCPQLTSLNCSAETLKSRNSNQSFTYTYPFIIQNNTRIRKKAYSLGHLIRQNKSIFRPHVILHLFCFNLHIKSETRTNWKT